MNVLWTKGKFHKIFSTDNVNLHASGDTAAADRCCRLCGGSTSLRAFGDTYVWEGVEERYDQLLFDCFEVRVTSSSDCLICEWCVRQLRCTERFKALVHAAFDKPPSSSNHSLQSKKRQKSDEEKSTENKQIIALLKSKMVPDKKKKRLSDRRAKLNSNSEGRRTNVQCKVCKQKYPMIVSCNSGKDFVCSRCKKNMNSAAILKKRNVAVQQTSTKEVGLHIKADLRGKNRLTLSKKPSQSKRQEVPRNRYLAKYRCAICPKKYLTPEHLAEHIKAEHAINVCPHCNKDLRTKDLLEKHMKMYKGHVNLNYYLAGPARFVKMRRDGKSRGNTREKRSL